MRKSVDAEGSPTSQLPGDEAAHASPATPRVAVADPAEDPNGRATQQAAREKRKKKAAKKNTRRRARLITVDSVPGTRDMYPPEMRLRQWLFDIFRDVALSAAFEEWDAPVLEQQELYKRKAGDEIVDQMYAFVDKDGYEVTLRPEATPSLARMMLGYRHAFNPPYKWFTIAQCWRFEDTKKGRQREHYQWNMDIVGYDAPAPEAELMACLVAAFERLGLTSDDVGIKVSSRKILEAIVAKAGVDEELFQPVCIIVDKSDKIGEEEVRQQLAHLGLSKEVCDSVVSATTITTLEQLEERLGVDDPCVKELRLLWDLAEGYGIAEWLYLDASVVRGLSYYTGIVFEAFDRKFPMRAICGGGRYDNLMQTFGGKVAAPFVGFGFGDTVIVDCLKERGLLPDLNRDIDDCLICLDKEALPYMFNIARRLRAQGRKVDTLLKVSKLKWVYKYLDRIIVRRQLFVGNLESESNTLSLKIVEGRVKATMPLEDFFNMEDPLKPPEWAIQQADSSDEDDGNGARDQSQVAGNQ